MVSVVEQGDWKMKVKPPEDGSTAKEWSHARIPIQGALAASLSELAKCAHIIGLREPPVTKRGCCFGHKE